MSAAVDECMIEDIKRDLLEDMMIGDNDIAEETLDKMMGWNEETQEYDSEDGVLFPQPITEIE